MISFQANADFLGTVRRTIQGNESVSLQVYADSSNLPTIGYGYALIIKVDGAFALNQNITNQIKGVSFAFHFEQSCHVAHALT